MTRATDYIESECRGCGLLGQSAVQEYRALCAGQPLFLVREPSNPVDSNAIILKTVLLQPCGYVAKEHALIIAPQLDRGVLWFATCTEPKGAFKYPQITLWKYNFRLGQKFKEVSLAYGASELIVEKILAGMYSRP